MSWNNDPELERRASDQNSDVFDRSAAQHELYRREARAEMQLNDVNQNLNQAQPVNQRTLVDPRSGYVGFGLIALIIGGILLNPAEAISAFNTDSMSQIELWLGMTIALWLMLFISLSLVNRGTEPFVKKLLKRFLFSLAFAGIVSAILVIRLTII